MSRSNYEMSNVNGCWQLRFAKCQIPVADTQLQNLSKITKVRKGSHYVLKASLVSPETSAFMWFD